MNTTPVSPFFEVSAPPRPQPLLVVQTDILDLSPDVKPLLHQDIDMSPPRRIVRVATPPPRAATPSARRRSLSAGPPPSRSRASSRAPEEYESGDGSGGDSLSLTSVSHDDNEDDNIVAAATEDAVKIPKPAGEVGRPNRGGYQLEDALNWSTARMHVFKGVINKLVDQHLDPTLLYAGQLDTKLRLVRKEAVKRLPDLEMYAMEWPVMDAVKMHLKYTSSKAHQHAHDAVSLKTQKMQKQRAHAK
ncbi:hypothetical protein BV20DRAFT_948015 [Pilatotrama ljubarskyi]|nr:hypothetical protein BV20DRAFT_948015 [Pilatotrama ljubarskyi]